VATTRLGAALVLFLAVLAGTFLLPSHRWDVVVTTWLQRAAPAPDLPASLFVFSGDAEISIPGAVLAGLALWPRNRDRAAGALWLAAGLLATSVLAVVLKHVVPHPGPPDEFQRAAVRFGIAVPEPFSFPSGHTMRATFFAATALGRAPLAGIVVVAAMMAALVYLGDHWTSDVLGGLCLGWACAEAARPFRPGA
jgi:membrane-associated phospholipid phosphatase